MPHSIPFANRVHAVVGIDVAKADIVMFDTASGATRHVENTRPALRRALIPLKDRALVVVDGAGGYERAVLEAAHRLNLPVHRADTSRVAAFIRSHGGRAKTDLVDARWLARYGVERGANLVRWTPPCRLRERLAELARHREDLIQQRTQAKNRRAAPGSGALAPLLRAQIAFLDRQIARIEVMCDALIDRIEGLKQDHAALIAIPGVGPATARLLIALMPELGTLNVKQAASLAGLAPHPRQSGQTDAYRSMTGGRKQIRRILFMAALSAARSHPALKNFHQRLKRAGKPPKLIIAAIARKLIVFANATIKRIKLN